MIHVVIVNDYGQITGGSTAVAVASALGLADAGYAVTYFCAVGPVASELLSHRNLRTVCLDQSEIAKDRSRWRAAKQGLRNGAAMRALRGILATLDPQNTVVHLHTWTKALSPFVAAVAATAGFRTIVTLHDFFVVCPTGGFFRHDALQLCHHRPLGLGCLSCNCDRRNYGHKFWRVARTLIQNKVLHLPERTAHFVAVSEFSLAVMRPFLPTSVPTTVLRNPVNCEFGPPVPVAQNSQFVFLGRLEEEKGARLFAEAVRLAGATGVMIGDGALAAELRACYPEIQFHGWLPPAEVRRVMRSARALVFPPLWYETLGLVVVEAASQGIPAIIADSCAATDYIQDGETGGFFEHGSAVALAAMIVRWMDRPAEVQRIGRSAYEWYWNNPWTTEKHVDGLLEVYQSVLGRALNKNAAELATIVP